MSERKGIFGGLFGKKEEEEKKEHPRRTPPANLQFFALVFHETDHGSGTCHARQVVERCDAAMAEL